MEPIETTCRDCFALIEIDRFGNVTALDGDNVCHMGMGGHTPDGE